MNEITDNLLCPGLFNAFELAFAELAVELEPDCHPLVPVAAALAVRSCRLGNVCLDLGEMRRSVELADGVELPGPEQFTAVLEKSALVSGPEGSFRPLVLDANGRLYLYRYWDYEKKLAASLQRLAAGELEISASEKCIELLERLFPRSDHDHVDWQKVAAAMALRKQLVVISGGPGTGKTSTVVKIIAMLQELAGPDGLRTALVAPTGKAVARLSESVKAVKISLPLAPAVRELIPDQAMTIHRLLGAVSHSPYFRHDADNPLRLDLLVVDEAAMVDLALTSKMLAALPEQCRLILVGDKEQLTSIEAGRVMGDICGVGQHRFSRQFIEYLATMNIAVDEQGEADCSTLLIDNVVVLEKNYRFEGADGIKQLCQAVRTGQPAMAMTVINDEDLPDVSLENYSSGWQKKFAAAVIDRYSGIFQASGADEALAAYNSFRVLCVHRHGPLGVVEINRGIEDILRRQGFCNDRTWYHGRPVMINRNDYGLGLFNGDTGLVIEDEKGVARICFAGPEGIRYISPVRLQHYETAYCLTVHKSQGAEFDSVLLLLPDDHSPLLTRELLYTAVSRARKKIVIWGEEKFLEQAINSRTTRSSGLRQLLVG